MNAAALRAELEGELEWRLDELRFLKNQLADLNSDGQKDRFRRALVVMLYSHFEGFWKAALTIYVEALNQEQILCKDALDNLAASTLHQLLRALSNNESKHPFFARTASDDKKLHALHRQVEFLARLPDVQATLVKIPAEVVDTESNLKPDVIRKNLYRLGFPIDLCRSHDGTIHQLLNQRNDISHGSARGGINERLFNELETAVLAVMNDLVRLLFDWANNRRYLKSP